MGGGEVTDENVGGCSSPEDLNMVIWSGEIMPSQSVTAEISERFVRVLYSV
jgi:hypothetical protein